MLTFDPARQLNVLSDSEILICLLNLADFVSSCDQDASTFTGRGVYNCLSPLPALGLVVKLEDAGVDTVIFSRWVRRSHPY